MEYDKINCVYYILKEVTALRIAIVDDELDFLMKLRDMINKYCPDSDKLNIYEFWSGEKLLYNFKRNMYDVIILDVEMEGLNGLETATKIRSYDNLVIIVFLTSHQEFALQGYEVKAFRYMLKGYSPILVGSGYPENHCKPTATLDRT